MALPTHIEDDYILLVCFNMWERGKPHEGLIDLAGIKVIGSDSLIYELKENITYSFYKEKAD